MKLDFAGPEVETSGVVTQGKFGIGNLGFVLHLLRSKIYSDIIRAVVQEYLSNARDAQREHGNAHIPVQVTLPSVFEQTWKVRDFGSSISPEDMVRVFIQYGESTKRTSNLQTGGFGIGCKTGFGYGDAFSVNTYRSGVVRNYACIIDESRCGELVLLGESSTSEPDGTQIIIPVKPGDVSRFSAETARATEFWSVRPEIVNGSVPWRNYEASATLKGDDWFIVPGIGGSKIGVLVDEIEYPYSENQLITQMPFTIAYNSRVYIKVGTGVVPVAANREQIEVDSGTKKLLQKRLDKIGVELLEKFKELVAAEETYIGACLKLHNCCSSLGMDIPKDFQWKGMKLYGAEIRDFPASFAVYHRGHNGNARKSTPYRLPISADTVYVSTDRDFDNVAENGATAILKAFPLRQKVCLVRWSKPEDALEFPGFELVKFSDYYKPKDRKAAMSRMLFYKFDRSLSEFRRSSVAEFEGDKNQKIWCRLTKGPTTTSRYYSGPSNGVLFLFDKLRNWGSNHGLDEILNFLSEDGISLYGFTDTLPDDRVADATEGLTSIEDAVRKQIQEENIDLDEVVFAHNRNFSDSYLFVSYLEQELVDNRATIAQASAFRAYLEASYEFTKKVTRYKKLGLICGVLTPGSKKFNQGIVAATQEMLEKYPMIRYLSVFSENRVDPSLSCKKDVFNYVEMVDAAS
jgi:hypothetical protein